MSLWIIGSASIRGTGHVKNDLPNQDAYEVAESRDGSSIAAVVSDGAGSASQAEEGATACARIMAGCLLDIAENHRDAIAGALSHNTRAQQLLQECVTQGIKKVRDTIDPTGQRLQDYHHTFTGAVLTPTGGFVVQIGDSPAIVTRAEIVLDKSDGHKEVDFFARHDVHMPEKGEYANETSFVTQPDWLASLRYFPFHGDNHRAVLLMSDGTGELAISKGQAFRPFIGTLIHQMLKARNQQERDQVLHDNLTHPQADELTADDKTLVILCHRDWNSLAALPYSIQSDLDEYYEKRGPIDSHLSPPEKQIPSVGLPLLTFVLGVVVGSAYCLVPWDAMLRSPAAPISKPVPNPADKHNPAQIVVPPSVGSPKSATPAKAVTNEGPK